MARSCAGQHVVEPIAGATCPVVSCPVLGHNTSVRHPRPVLVSISRNRRCRVRRPETGRTHVRPTGFDALTVAARLAGPIISRGAGIVS